MMHCESLPSTPFACRVIASLHRLLFSIYPEFCPIRTYWRMCALECRADSSSVPRSPRVLVRPTPLSLPSHLRIVSYRSIFLATSRDVILDPRLVLKAFVPGRFQANACVPPAWSLACLACPLAGKFASLYSCRGQPFDRVSEQ